MASGRSNATGCIACNTSTRTSTTPASPATTSTIRRDGRILVRHDEVGVGDAMWAGPAPRLHASRGADPHRGHRHRDRATRARSSRSQSEAGVAMRDSWRAASRRRRWNERRSTRLVRRPQRTGRSALVGRPDLDGLDAPPRRGARRVAGSATASRVRLPHLLRLPRRRLLRLRSPPRTRSRSRRAELGTPTTVTPAAHRARPVPGLVPRFVRRLGRHRGVAHRGLGGGRMVAPPRRHRYRTWATDAPTKAARARGCRGP